MSTAESGTAGTEAQRAKQDRAAEDSAPRAQPRVEPRSSPYFGLDYYDERFSAWFFGRQAEIDMVITNLQAARLTPEVAHGNVHVDGGLVSGVRVGQNGADVVRVVLDVNEVKDYTASLANNPPQLLIDLYGNSTPMAIAENSGRKNAEGPVAGTAQPPERESAAAA